MMKRISKSYHPSEVEIAQLFSANSLASDPRNHCIQILEVLQDPEDEDLAVMVMPFLRPYDNPRFETFGEAVECFRQLFEVIILYSPLDWPLKHTATTGIEIHARPSCCAPVGWFLSRIKNLTVATVIGTVMATTL
jgi:hypothetical protein